MNWPPYCKGEYSRDKWPGGLPEGWTTRRLKTVLTEPLLYGANEAADSDDPANPRFVRITDIAANGGLKPDTFRSLPAEKARPYMLNEGDLLFARSGATVGKSVIYSSAWGEACFAGYLIRARPNPYVVSARYVRYFTESLPYWQHIASEQIQATIQNVSAERYGNLLIPMPELLGQNAIVAFLDRETAKIDALIEKQNQLIDTLREDRTATITHAVTKGLNPDAQMKDSGVEWIGSLPSHWTASRIGFACQILTGFPFKSEGFLDDPHEVALLRGANVGVARLDWTDVVYWPRSDASAMSNYALASGDIVMGLDRPFIGSGIRVARVREEDIPSLLLQRVARLRSNSNFDQDFVYFLLTGPGIIHHLTPIFTGVSVPHVSPDQVGDLPIPQPPLYEQRSIATHLKNTCDKIDLLIGKSGEVVATLREYRSALITAAVTGKIDVRKAT
jgi:type I restriction enzyme S subunit